MFTTVQPVATRCITQHSYWYCNPLNQVVSDQASFIAKLRTIFRVSGTLLAGNARHLKHPLDFKQPAFPKLLLLEFQPKNIRISTSSTLLINPPSAQPEATFRNLVVLSTAFLGHFQQYLEQLVCTCDVHMIAHSEPASRLATSVQLVIIALFQMRPYPCERW